MTQSAVEWLIQELKKAEYLGTFCAEEAFAEEEAKMLLICEKAKEMERLRISEEYYKAYMNAWAGIEDEFEEHKKENG